MVLIVSVYYFYVGWYNNSVHIRRTFLIQLRSLFVGYLLKN